METKTFEIVSLSGTHTVTVTTEPAKKDTSYTIYRATDGNAFKCAGLLKPGDNLKKFITTQAKRMWIKVTSVKEIR